MKILAVSLLRIGDIVLAAPALRELRDRLPDAEIHLLVNSQFIQITPLLPYIDKVIPFERELMQKGLGSYETPFFDSYERLTEIVDRLNGEKYDKVLNFTQSRLSGWLLSLIEAKEKVGLCFDGEGRASFGSNWFRYLNSQVDTEGREVFHFSDVFRFAISGAIAGASANGLERGLEDSQSRGSLLVETQKGIDEATSFFASMTESGAGAADRSGLLVIQAFTSDSKKDWGIESFTEVARQFSVRHPDASIAFVGAPFERERLEPAVEKLRSQGIRAGLAIVSFEGALSLVKRSRAVLSGDTSIMHLACAARVPVIEVSIGSSDPYRTGAYANGSVIVQSKEACAPCGHAKACHRESHFCAKRVATEPVAMLTSEVFARRSFQLRTIADEYASDIEILTVRSSTAGFWSAAAVNEPFTEAAVGRWIDLTCRKLWLQSSRSSSLDRLGSETLKLAAFLKEVHPTVSEIEWRHLLDAFEIQATSVERRINSFKTGIRYLHGSFEDQKKMREFVAGLIGFRERIRHSALLSSFKASLDQLIEDDISPPFTRFRRIVDVVNEIENRTAIYLRIIRALNRQIETSQGMDKT